MNSAKWGMPVSALKVRYKRIRQWYSEINVQQNATRCAPSRYPFPWIVILDDSERPYKSNAVKLTSMRNELDSAITYSVQSESLPLQFPVFGLMKKPFKGVDPSLTAFHAQLVLSEWQGTLLEKSQGLGDTKGFIAHCSLLLLRGGIAQGVPYTTTISDILRVPIWVLIIPDASTRTVWQLPEDT
jgi:hypothetical protein